MLNSKEIVKYTKELSVLFVEDHEELRKNTTEILKSFFKRVDSANDGLDALAKTKDYFEKNLKYYDIVISDIQMPNLNGIDLTKKLYKTNPSQILIILSAHDDSKYLLPLINLGIEQFIKKPIDYQELLRVLLNSSKKIKQNSQEKQNKLSDLVYFNHEYTFDKETNAFSKDKESIYLTKYEIIFLQLLTDNLGKVYSNEEISKYYESFSETIDTQNIRKLVSKLRKKLPENSLESIYGIGYRIIPHID